MGRNEAPSDLPGGTLAEFAAGLRALRERAGSPPYEVLAPKAQCSASTLSLAASGRVMPSLPLTLTYVRACGGDPREWEARWHALNAALNPGSHTPGWGIPAPVPADWSRLPVRGAPSDAVAPDGRHGTPDGQDRGPDAQDGGPDGQDGEPDRAADGRDGGWDDAVTGRPAPAGVTAPDLTRPPSTLPWDKAVAWNDDGVAGPSRPARGKEESDRRPGPSERRPADSPQVTAPVPPRRPPDQGLFPSDGTDAVRPRPAAATAGPAPLQPPGGPAGGPPGPPAVTRPGGRRPAPPPDRPTPSARNAARAVPRHRAARSYRGLLVTGGTAVALSGAALGAWLAFGDFMSHPRRASQVSMPMPQAGRSARVPAPAAARRGGTAVTAAPSATTTGTPPVAAAVAPPPAGTGTLTAGPGCAPSAAASGTARTGAGGDGWIEVGGGPAECGGHALATYTTTGTGTEQDTYTWRFRTSPDARCTLRLFIPDTNPSSASAHYDVYGSAKRLGGFTVVQAEHKGRWVEEGTWIAFSGVLQLRLTDQADYPGAHHHVTASATAASCR